MNTPRPHTVDGNYSTQASPLRNRAIFAVAAGVLTLVGGVVMNNRRAGHMDNQAANGKPTFNPPSVVSPAIEVEHDPLALPFSKLSGAGKAEEDPAYLDFLQAEPKDVRMLTNGERLEISGPPIWVTIPEQEGFRKIPLSYAQTPEGKQVLKVGPNYYVVRYLKIGFPGHNMVLEAEVSHAEKTEDGIANTGEKTLPILGTFTDTSVIPFTVLENNVKALTNGTVSAGKLLSVYTVGPRIFYFKLVGDTPMDIAMTKEEKVEIKRIYNDTIKEHDDNDTR